MLLVVNRNNLKNLQFSSGCVPLPEVLIITFIISEQPFSKATQSAPDCESFLVINRSARQYILVKRIRAASADHKLSLSYKYKYIILFCVKNLAIIILYNNNILVYLTLLETNKYKMKNYNICCSLHNMHNNFHKSFIAPNKKILIKYNKMKCFIL